MFIAKEIHLKHRAPVISICVLDRNAMPLPAPLEVLNECAKAPDMTGGHIVVISSEEQLKVTLQICHYKTHICLMAVCVQNEMLKCCADQENSSIAGEQMMSSGKL